MQRRTGLAYEAVLRTVNVLLGGAPNLRKVITDFEPATRRVIRAVFPHVEHQGCFFHFVRVSDFF